MQPEGTAAAWRRTKELLGAAGPPAAGWRGSMRKSRRGCSPLVSAIRAMPAMERLLGRMRDLAMFTPGVEAVVDDEARQVGERDVGRRDRSTIGRRAREQLAGRLHRGFLGERDLVSLHEFTPPGVDLLVNVDLHRTDIAAASIKRGGEGQIAVFARVERRIDDEADGTGIVGAVA